MSSRLFGVRLSTCARRVPRLTRAFGSYKSAPAVLSELGLRHGDVNPGVYSTSGWFGSGKEVESVNPSTGEVLAKIATAFMLREEQASKQDRLKVLGEAKEAYRYWRSVPAPKRGNVLAKIKTALEEKKEALGALVSLEMGKIYSEGKGEVQEFIDICDYGVGLSRSMEGRHLPSERPGHVMLEVPNPLGLCGVITAFNFPVAVYGWNLSLSLVCGNSTLWAPAPSTPLCAMATQRIIADVFEKEGVPGAVSALLSGGKETGAWMTEEKDIPLLSFTGSERTGLEVGAKVTGRAGKTILELGSLTDLTVDQAAIVLADANLAQAVPTILFSALGTTSQRCTTTRRLLLQRSISQDFLSSLLKGYSSLVPSRLGDPLHPNTLVGPLHSRSGMKVFDDALKTCEEQGGRIVFPEPAAQSFELKEGGLRNGNWVTPRVVKWEGSAKDYGKDWIVNKEVFGPLLHVIEFDTLEEAIEINNSVEQGLSSSLFTK
ncbi:ALDH-like protein [Atractiella rhizophila]|nr:ALDH-like protein [Atractiella rhizophila]